MGAKIDKNAQPKDDNLASYIPMPTGPLYLPHSHAAAYAALEKTELVAVADVLDEKVKAAQRRYKVPRGYTDYREMIEKEKPDIVSIATRPATHAEITIFATEHRVKGIYCEKPLCCSMDEADAMVEACEKHNVKFNLNTQRRYTPPYQKIREMIDSGEIGEVHCVIGHCGVNTAAQWMHTHTSDMLMFLAGDAQIDYVQGTVNVDEADFEDNRIETDPGITLGFVKFRNGVLGYIVSTSGYEFEVSGTKGKIRTLNNGYACQLRRIGERNLLEEAPFPDFPIESGMTNAVKDIIEAIETGQQTKGNIQLAKRSEEMIIGFVESHRQGGARVRFPIENRGLYIGRPNW